MSITQLNGGTQIQSATVTNTQIAAAAAIATTKLADSANFILRGGSVPFTADQSFGGFKITSLGTPTASTDGATKGYVDGVLNGLDWKQSVRCASTGAGTLATSFENGDTLDGVTLATGDRILLKNQSAGADNGIYVVAASGAPARAADADSSAEVTGGLTVFVSEGTTLGNTAWSLTTDDPITLGSTALVFSQVSGPGAYTASNGIVLTGVNFAPTYGTGANTFCQGNDSRLSDARTPVGTALTGAQIWVGSAGNVAAAVTMSGHGTLSNTGVLTVSSAVALVAKFITRETPSGTINGSNATFTLANTPVAGTEHLYLNGILQDSGAGNDYTISGATITALNVPISGDKLRVSYIST